MKRLLLFLTLALLLLPAPADAAITVDGATVGNTNGSTGTYTLVSCAWSAGDMVVVYMTGTTTSAPTVTGGSLSWAVMTDGTTAINNSVGATAPLIAEVAFPSGTASGQTITVAPGAFLSSAVFVAYKGQAATSPVSKVANTNVSNGGSSAAIVAPPVSPTVGNTQVVVLCAYETGTSGPTTPSSPSAYTQTFNFTTSNPMIQSYLQTAVNASSGTFSPGTIFTGNSFSPYSLYTFALLAATASPHRRRGWSATF